MTGSSADKQINSIFLAGGTAEVTGAKYVYASKDSIGKDAVPYTIEYDVEVVAINENNIKNGKCFMDGYNSNTNQMHLLRAFAVPNETTPDIADYYSDRAYLRVNNLETSTIVATIMEGNSYHFKLHVNPSTGEVQFEGYNLAIPSEVFEATYITGNLGSTASEFFFRFNDNIGSFKLSNFAFYNNAESDDIYHTHSDAWLTNGENAATSMVVTEDNKVVYSYKCYCGKTVTYGISEVIAEEIAPVYGATDETVIIPELEAHAGDFALVGNISAMELPKENK